MSDNSTTGNTAGRIDATNPRIGHIVAFQALRRQILVPSDDDGNSSLGYLTLIIELDGSGNGSVDSTVCGFRNVKKARACLGGSEYYSIKSLAAGNIPQDAAEGMSRMHDMFLKKLNATFTEQATPATQAASIEATAYRVQLSLPNHIERGEIRVDDWISLDIIPPMKDELMVFSFGTSVGRKGLPKAGPWTDTTRRTLEAYPRIIFKPSETVTFQMPTEHTLDDAALGEADTELQEVRTLWHNRVCRRLSNAESTAFTGLSTFYSRVVASHEYSKIVFEEAIKLKEGRDWLVVDKIRVPNLLRAGI